jgi:Type IV pili methyl-accepting chemotaxis transducer N-term
MTLMLRRNLIVAGFASALSLQLPCASAQVIDLNDAINKAGRQRMLSQRLGKAWLAIGQSIEPALARTVLDASLALFDRQLVELKAFAPSAQIKATYAELESVWGEYKTALVGAQPTKAAAPRLIELDGAVLALAHQGTVQYEAVAARPVGKLVNVAGRQRMLSQRAAKFYLAQSWETGIASARPELDKARVEFIAAHDVLYKAPEATAAIRAELELAQQQWVFFDNALQLGNESGQGARRAAEVFRASENILQVMDRVTGLYARIGRPGDL